MAKASNSSSSTGKFELGIALDQGLLGPLLLSDVASEALDAQHAPSRSELALSRFLQPHLLTVRAHKSEGYGVRRFARMQFTYERHEALTIFGMNPAEKPAALEFRSGLVIVENEGGIIAAS